MKDGSKSKVAPKKRKGAQKASTGKKPGRHTIGIDLGDKKSRYAILNADGEVIDEGDVANEVAALALHFGGDTPRARVALEAGGQSAWIERELKRFGHEVIVAHARQLAWITAADDKSDRSDAEKLARLARADLRLLKPVQHRTAEQQAQLGVVRARDAVVRARALLVNAARGLAKGFGVRLPPTVSATFSQRALEKLPAFLKPALEGLLAEIDRLSVRIGTYDKQIVDLVSKRADLKPLLSIPGVGALTALAFSLTLGSAERFAHSRDVGAFIGLQPKRSQSGESDPQLAITKAGNGYLRKLAVQCAHHILGHAGRDSALRRWGLRLAGSGGSSIARKRAIVAVARKLLVLMHHLWRTQRLFEAFPQQAGAQATVRS